MASNTFHSAEQLSVNSRHEMYTESALPFDTGGVRVFPKEITFQHVLSESFLFFVAKATQKPLRVFSISEILLFVLVRTGIAENGDHFLITQNLVAGMDIVKDFPLRPPVLCLFQAARQTHTAKFKKL